MIFSHDDVLNMLKALKRYEVKPIIEGEAIAVVRPVLTADRTDKGDFILSADVDDLMRKVEEHRGPVA